MKTPMSFLWMSCLLDPATGADPQWSDNPPPFHCSRPLASLGSWMARPADTVDRALLEKTGIAAVIERTYKLKP